MHFPCSHLITRTVSANEKLNPKCDFYLPIVVKNNRYSEPKGFPACFMHYSAFYLIVTASGFVRRSYLLPVFQKVLKTSKEQRTD